MVVESRLTQHRDQRLDDLGAVPRWTEEERQARLDERMICRECERDNDEGEQDWAE